MAEEPVDSFDVFELLLRPFTDKIGFSFQIFTLFRETQTRNYVFFFLQTWLFQLISCCKPQHCTTLPLQWVYKMEAPVFRILCCFFCTIKADGRWKIGVNRFCFCRVLL